MFSSNIDSESPANYRQFIRTFVLASFETIRLDSAIMSIYSFDAYAMIHIKTRQCLIAEHDSYYHVHCITFHSAESILNDMMRPLVLTPGTLSNQGTILMCLDSLR